MSEWKKKTSMQTQMGKACLAHKSSVGVRGLALVGPELTCPSGEQFTNGGFGTGDFTGWTTTGNMNVVNYNPFEGTYHARTLSQGTAEQTFLNPIPESCFVAASVFKIRILGTCIASPIGCAQATIRIRYSDSTETVISGNVPALGTWVLGPAGYWYVEINLKPYVATGKTVTSIRIELNRASSPDPEELDGCTLVP